MIILWAILFVLAVQVFWFLNLLGLPGNWFMVAAAALYTWLMPHDTRAAIGWPVVGTIAGLAVVGELVEFAASAAGVQKAGGSRRRRGVRTDRLAHRCSRRRGCRRADSDHRLDHCRARVCWRWRVGRSDVWRDERRSRRVKKLGDRQSRVLGSAVRHTRQGDCRSDHGRRRHRCRVRVIHPRNQLQKRKKAGITPGLGSNTISQSSGSRPGLFATPRSPRDAQAADACERHARRLRNRVDRVVSRRKVTRDDQLAERNTILPGRRVGELRKDSHA